VVTLNVNDNELKDALSFFCKNHRRSSIRKNDGLFVRCGRLEITRVVRPTLVRINDHDDD